MLARPSALAALAATSLLAVAAAQTPVYRSVANAYADPALSVQPDNFLRIPGSVIDLVRSGGGQWVELPNGTARLTCRVFSQTDLYGAFLVDILFSGRVAPGNPGYPPAGAPDLEMMPTAYVPGGSIDPGTFVYYTSATGSLTGVRNFIGGYLTLAAAGPVQIGVGANNRNDHLGLQGMFNVTVVSQSSTTFNPTGPALLSLDFVNPYGERTTHPQPDNSFTTLIDGRAMTLPGVADDYVFVPTADFVERHDGTAQLTGTLARPSDLTDAWDVTLDLGGRVDPGEANWPPAGSPVLQLLSNAYHANGGPIDPGHWHYYTTGTASLVGNGINAGGEIALAQNVATQVGGGTNQTNTYFGTYSRFVPSIVTQPTGRTLALTGNVEMFTLTAVFPVLPFPALTVPMTTPTGPTLSDQGIVLEGENLAWIELVGIDAEIHGLGTAHNFSSGYVRVVDNTHVEVHTRPGTLPGMHAVRVFNAAIQSNTIQVDLTAPTSPVLYAEPVVGLFEDVHVRTHPGTVIGPALTLMVLSQTLGASVAPGLATLTIGNGFTDFVLDPTIYTNDFLSGVAEANYGPINSSLLGTHYYFQGLVLDIGAGTLPLPATNHWRVDFQ